MLLTVYYTALGVLLLVNRPEGFGYTPALAAIGGGALIGGLTFVCSWLVLGLHAKLLSGRSADKKRTPATLAVCFVLIAAGVTLGVFASIDFFEAENALSLLMLGGYSGVVIAAAVRT